MELCYRRSLILILRGSPDLLKTIVQFLFEIIEGFVRLLGTAYCTHPVNPCVVLAVHFAVPITVLHHTSKVMWAVHIGKDTDRSGRVLTRKTIATFAWRRWRKAGNVSIEPATSRLPSESVSNRRQCSEWTRTYAYQEKHVVGELLMRLRSRNLSLWHHRSMQRRFCGLTGFLKPVDRHLVGLFGRETSPSQSLYPQSTAEQDTIRRLQLCFEWVSNSRSQCSSFRRQYTHQDAQHHKSSPIFMKPQLYALHSVFHCWMPEPHVRHFDIEFN